MSLPGTAAIKPRIWFERAILPELLEKVSDLCTPLGPGNATPDHPYADLPRAQGIVAGAYHYGATMMDLAPDLKVIARTGIGVDLVDLEAATERGIAVCNTPDGPTISTAEHTVTLMLTVAKNIKQSERRLIAAEPELYARHEAVELDDKTLGLVGFGRIARRVAGFAAALGMHVHAYDPFLDNFGEAVREKTLEHLLKASDVVSLHVPLTESTRRSFGPKQFAAMKPRAIFINTARGGLVDHDALAEALESGHLFGVGLDVSDPEPLPAGNRLLERDDAVITPHVATATVDGRRRLLQMAFELVLEVLSGHKPASLMNPEVWV